MKPVDFTILCRRHNLWKRGLGQAVIADLAAIVDKPAPLKRWGRGDARPPSDYAHLGQLISAGLVERAEDFYVVTESGRVWLSQLKAVHLI